MLRYTSERRMWSLLRQHGDKLRTKDDKPCWLSRDKSEADRLRDKVCSKVKRTIMVQAQAGMEQLDVRCKWQKGKIYVGMQPVAELTLTQVPTLAMQYAQSADQLANLVVWKPDALEAHKLPDQKTMQQLLIDELA